MRRTIALLLLFLFVACQAKEEPVRVFAAASLTDAAEELARRFEESQGGEVQLNLAASSTLARQIEAGAPADVFWSANRDWMDRLARKGKIEKDSRKTIAGNRLVLIAGEARGRKVRFESGFPIETLVEGRVAIGDPGHVPCGIYARAALEKLGWYGRLEEHIVPAADARRVLALVQSGACDLGIGYATDARNEAVTVLGTVPGHLHPPIRYPVAICRRKSRERVRAFRTFLESPEAREILQNHGFTTPKE